MGLDPEGQKEEIEVVVVIEAEEEEVGEDLEEEVVLEILGEEEEEEGEVVLHPGGPNIECLFQVSNTCTYRYQ